MSSVTTLIQPKEIVDAGIVKASPLSSRFDASQISPWVYIAEYRFLLKPKSFMCQDFYNDLLAQKNATPSNYNPDLGAIVKAYPSNADYETFWKEYLLPYLSLASVYVALPFIATQTGSNGLFDNNTEFSTNNGQEASKTHQDTMLQNLEDAKARMIEFLCRNKATYPLFDQDSKICGCCDEDDACSDCNFEGSEGRDLGFIFYD